MYIWACHKCRLCRAKCKRSSKPTNTQYILLARRKFSADYECVHTVACLAIGIFSKNMREKVESDCMKEMKDEDDRVCRVICMYWKFAAKVFCLTPTIAFFSKIQLVSLVYSNQKQSSPSWAVIILRVWSSRILSPFFALVMPRMQLDYTSTRNCTFLLAFSDKCCHSGCMTTCAKHTQLTPLRRWFSTNTN